MIVSIIICVIVVSGMISSCMQWEFREVVERWGDLDEKAYYFSS
jgi:hypothetical protein